MAKITHAIAKSDDKTVQITFTIPYPIIKESQTKIVEDYAKTAEIAGFRKGKAPIEKVKEKIEPNILIEKSLGLILPKALGEVITQDKLKPAIYPKFEVVKANTNEDWQVRATTCELPEVNLGDYKKIISQSSKAKAIWTPDKGSPGEKPKEQSREEKEQEVIKTLLSAVEISIPNILVEEEVNSRLASLLERIEKLGLTLESYLSSLNKKPEELRNEYETQAKNTISLDLILNKIATEEKIQISEEQINDALKAVSADPKLFEKLNTPEQRLLIKGVLMRRGALDYLVTLL